MGKIFRFLKKIIKGFQNYIQHLIWVHISPRKFSPDAYNIHLLIVKKNDYVYLAKTAIESFSFFHPNSNFFLHCDSKTFDTGKKVFKKSKVQINILRDVSDSDSWQDAKVQILLALSGTEDIFMDADLRWNGVMPTSHGLTFFVEEYDMKQKSPDRQFLEVLKSIPQSGVSMKNTSFLCFNKVKISPQQKIDLLEFLRNFELLIKKADVGYLDIPGLIRLKEQIALSIFSETWGCEINFLKKVDAHKDGRFVESSYFGATGSKF